MWTPSDVASALLPWYQLLEPMRAHVAARWSKALRQYNVISAADMALLRRHDG